MDELSSQSETPQQKFTALAKKHAELRRQENDIARALGNAADAARPALEATLASAKAERSTFLNELISVHVGSLLKTQLPTTIALDVEGLKISIGPDGAAGIHSHLPYPNIGKSALKALIDDNLLVVSFFNDIQRRLGGKDDDNLDRAIMRDINYFDSLCNELAFRTAAPEERPGILKEWETMLAAHCHEDIVSTSITARLGKEPREDSRDEIVDSLQGYPERLYGAQWLGKVPVTSLRHMLKRGDEMSGQVWTTDHNASRLAEIAEVLSVRGSWDELRAYSEWHGLRLTHEGARHGRRAFESRRSQVRDHHMYEPVKILGVILSTLSPAQRDAAGIRIVRAPFVTRDRSKVDCVGIWSRYGFNRIYIAPEDHVRPQYGDNGERITERAALPPDTLDGIPDFTYAEIPQVSRVQFEGLEGLMAARSAFNDALWRARFEHENPRDAIRLSQSLLLLIVSEVDASVYTAAEEATRIYHDAIRENGSVPDATRDAYVRAMSAVDAWYADKLLARDPKLMLDETLTFDEKNIRDDTFDASWHEAYARDTERPNPHITRYPEVEALSMRSKTFATPKEGLPYGRELQAVRILGIERRPFIRAAWGADEYKENPERARASAQYIEALFRQAVKYRANVLVPGTQIELTMRLAKMYHEYLAGFPEGDAREKVRQEGPRFFCIEPGGSTWSPGNPHFDKTDSATYLRAPFDTILTPYRAGWADHGTASEHFRNICFQQAFIRRIAPNQTTASVTLNGGTWANPENYAAAFDGAELLFAGDMGRHSTLCARLCEAGAIPALIDASAADFPTRIRTFVESHDDINDDEMRKLIGTDAYLRELRLLIQNADVSRARSVDAASFEAALEDNLKNQADVIAKETIPVE